MKVLAICLNSKFIHSSLAPWCIRAGINEFCKENISVAVYEATINIGTEKIVDEILSEKADIAAFSCYIWNITKTLEICRILKERSSIVIVLGGPEVCYREKNILSEYLFIDFVLRGEGEWCFSKFADTFYCKGELSLVSGLTYRENDEIISVPEKFYTDTPPSPYCDEYFNSLNGRIAYIEASRGCPFSCSYCLSGRLDKVRFFEFERTKNALIQFSENRVKTVKFIDRTFNASERHAYQILEFIKENYHRFFDYGVRFHFEISADILTDKLICVLSEMPEGLIQLEAGIQTFNKNTATAINRRSDSKKLEKNLLRLISLRNIHIHTDLIAGLPYEDINSFAVGFNRAFSMRPHMLQLGFLKLLYGTKMRDAADSFAKSFSAEPPYEIKETLTMSYEDILKLKHCEAALERMYNSGRFLLTTDYLLDCLELTAFELFCEIGSATGLESVELYKFVEVIYNTFMHRCDREKFREKLLCDLISTDVNIKVPAELKKYEPEYKTVKKHFSEKFGENIKLVLLNNATQAYIVKRSDKKNLYNRYEGRIVKTGF